MNDSRSPWPRSIDLGLILSEAKRYTASDSKIKAMLALAIALAIWAVLPILIRLVEQEIAPRTLVFHRFWIASLVLIVAQIAQFIVTKLTVYEHHETEPTDKDNEVSLASETSYPYRTVLALVGAATFSALNTLFWLTSIDQTTIANSALLHNFTPVFVALIGFLLLGQRFDSRFIVGVVIAIGGSVILGWEDIAYKTDQLQGDGIALISALFWAIYLLFLRGVRSLPTLTVTFYCCLISAFLLGGTLLLAPVNILYPTSRWGWISTIILGLSTIVCTSMMTYSLKFLASGFVAVTTLIDPILSSIAAWVALSEAVSLYTLAAFPIILFGIYLATTSASASSEEA